MIFDLDSRIRVKTFGHISQSRGAWHSGQRSPHSTIVYCTHGAFDMKVENEFFHVESGDVLLIPPEACFVPLEGGACKYFVLNFSATVVVNADLPKKNLTVTAHVDLEDGHAYSCRGNYASVSRVENLITNAPVRVKSIFERADRLKPGESFYDQLLLDQLTRELLICLNAANPQIKSARLSEILKYIEQGYKEKLTLSTLSKEFSLSESYISRLFKNELDCKPSEYINNVRISAAETLLRATDMSVSEIAERVGYSDVYYFSKTFKRLVGCSPSKMR